MTQIFLGFLALGITAIYAWGISLIPILAFGDPLGPRLLPMLLAGMLGVIGVALLISGLRERVDWPAQLAGLRAWLRGPEPRTVGLATAWLGLYYLAFNPLGYLLSTMLFLAGLMLVAHRGRRWPVLCIALLFPLGSYLLFNNVFNMGLPDGILPF